MSEPTKTKAEVRYRPAPDKDHQRCGNCSMFSDGYPRFRGSCSLVQGEIKAEYVCDRWEPKR